MPKKAMSDTAAKRSLPGRPAVHGPETTGNCTATMGLDMLQAVMHLRGPATLTEIANATDMSVATASRYLASLTRREFLRRDNDTGRYDLGPAAIELGAAAMARVDAIRVACDAMRPLTEETQLVSILAVWGSNGPTMIKCETGSNQLPMLIREGINLSVAITAVGRIFLAYHDDKAVDPILKRDLEVWNATASARDRIAARQVSSLRADIRERAFASVAGLHNPALQAMAAPVFGPAPHKVMSLGLAGLKGSFDLDYAGRPARTLRKTAERITRALGGAA